jgi:hypothetical protein
VPVVLPEAVHLELLDLKVTDAERVAAIIRDYAQDEFELIPVRAIAFTREEDKN